jgi:hydroxyacylglutathione hydrolase
MPVQAIVTTGGHPAELYDTFTEQVANLPDHTLAYPGHDYIINNLAFTLDREPDNERASSPPPELTDQDPGDALVTSLGLEKDVKAFSAYVTRQ